MRFADAALTASTSDGAASASARATIAPPNPPPITSPSIWDAVRSATVGAARGPSAPDDRTLGIVDLSIFPHLENPDLPWNTMATAERWTAGMPGAAYAIADQTALKVTNGTVDVVSEGHWKLLTPKD